MGFPGMRDVDTTLRDGTTDLTTTETTSTVLVRGTPLGGLALCIECPTEPTDANETLDVTLEDGDQVGGGDAALLLTVPQIVKTDTYPKRVIRRFYTTKDYVRTVLTTAGTTPDFKGVKVWLTVWDVNRDG
jgi:hypothetical protein